MTASKYLGRLLWVEYGQIADDSNWRLAAHEQSFERGTKTR